MNFIINSYSWECKTAGFDYIYLFLELKMNLFIKVFYTYNK